MSTRGRTTFTVEGHHEHLHLVRDSFISRGLALVSWADKPDFCLLGAQRLSPFHLPLVASVPLFVLSSSDVYLGSTAQGHNVPLDEGVPAVITPLSDRRVQGALYTLLVENEALYQEAPCMVVRVFDVYGPCVKTGIIREFIKEFKETNKISVPYPGYQVRSFLYVDDFLECTFALCAKFLAGSCGVFNVGSAEPVSLNKAAQSVCHFLQKETPLDTVYHNAPSDFCWFLVPDITRTAAVAEWAPHVSFRRGVWETVSAAISE